jgi:undecaprenyl-diphosphatase
MDYNITFYLNHLWSGTFVDYISATISSIPFLSAFFITLSILILIFDKKNGKWVFISALLAMVIFLIINDIFFKFAIRDFFVRLRPYLAFPNEIITIGVKSIDSSFPSSHVAATTALFTVYVCCYRKTWPIAIILILTMAFSRIHNGMHYFSDVVFGMLFGIFYGMLAIYFVKKIKQH